MPTVIAIASQKGGVAKTTTSGNLGHALARLGQRVLLIDLDAQMNLTTWLGVESFDGATADVVLQHPERLNDAPGPTVAGPDLDLIYSSLELAGVQSTLKDTSKAPNTILRRALRPLDSRYDIVLIDCPPNMGMLVVNALVAASLVIVPVVPQSFAIDGLDKMLEAVKELVEAEVVNEAPVIRTLLTIVDAFDPEQKLNVQKIRDRTDVVVCDTFIRKAPMLARGPDRRQTIFDLAPKSAGASDYGALAEELLA